jgi:putative chitinase
VNVDDALRAVTGDAERWRAPILSACARFDIGTDKRVAMFLAQCGHESNGFRDLSENLNYSAAGLLKTWPKRFDGTSAAQYARQPERIANHVYANRMGNGDEASGDGWRYRGRGLLQITFRDNYREIGDELGLPLEHEPDTVATPAVAALTAARYWHATHCNEYADRGDYRAISSIINTGHPDASIINGYEDRLAWLERTAAAV